MKANISKTYQIEFFPEAFDCTVGEFIRRREQLRIPTQEFKSCLICNNRLAMNRKPIVISVSGKGNRFACKACYTKYKNGGEANEETEL